MKSLAEAVEEIKKNYPQKFTSDVHIAKDLFKKGPFPKYLYRGESQLWDSTRSTAGRNNLLGNANFKEINYWTTGRNIITGETQNIYSLYHFLRESLYDVSVVSDKSDDMDIEKEIGGIFQHYGFETSLVDFTSDVEVAAFFASSGSAIGEIGQIFILPSAGIENYIFDLSLDKANRPREQKAFALVLPAEYDLKSKNIVNLNISIQFCLTEEDMLKYYRSDLLSTVDDKVVIDLMDWFNSHINGNPLVSDQVQFYFRSKLKFLK